MKRIAITPRDNWEELVRSQGMQYLTEYDEPPCWEETAYYEFTASEINAIEAASYELNRLCLDAVEYVIANRSELFPRFAIPEAFHDYIVDSWGRDEITIYGRFDLAFDGQSPPKLLEYNADTPTALLEAGVIQWHWLQDFRQRNDQTVDQFNTLHDRLIEAWQRYRPLVKGTMYFASMKGTIEDYMTVGYLRDTAIQANLATEFLYVDEIRWNQSHNCFVRGVGTERTPGYREEPIRNLFKLYPWEWMVREQFGAFIPQSQTQWLEAPWKMLLSNKAILPILYQLNPDCPYLLRAEFEPFGDTYVRKPILAREGKCLAIIQEGKVVASVGGVDIYQKSPMVYQAFNPLPNFEGNYPVVGSWMVNGWACGLGIREERGLITQNTSRFVPHVFA